MQERAHAERAPHPGGTAGGDEAQHGPGHAGRWLPEEMVLPHGGQCLATFSVVTAEEGAAGMWLVVGAGDAANIPDCAGRPLVAGSSG